MLPMIGAGGYAIAADGVSPVTSASFGEMLPMIESDRIEPTPLATLKCSR